MDNKLKQIVKKLRKNQTVAENILWKELRNKKQGYKFRRQHPFPPYIVDFYCHEKNIILEIDGQIHKHYSLYDHAREKQLTKMGYKMLRFTNIEICRNLESVIQKIQEELH